MVNETRTTSIAGGVAERIRYKDVLVNIRYSE